MYKPSIIALLAFVFILAYSHTSYAQPSYAFTGPVAVFSYDRVGNRVLREIEVKCVGLGCPTGSVDDPAGKMPVKNDTTAVAGSHQNQVPNTESLANQLENDTAATTGTQNNNTTITTPDMISAYPNPVMEELSVYNSTWKSTDKALVVVYDINSKVMLKKDFTQAKDKIYFKNYTPGTYMVQYYLNGMPAQLWKIIKM